MKKDVCARKKYGLLNLFIGGNVIKSPTAWITTDSAVLVRLNKEDFPDVKWEDDEPTEVLLAPKKR